MDQFRHLGKVLGSMKALMVFKDEIQVNQKQCVLLVDVFNLAFERIAEEIKENLKFEERHMRWKTLEYPLKEMNRIFKEAEHYVHQCLEMKDWWAKVILLAKNTDCVEYHIHNLLSCLPIVIETIEMAGEVTGCDHDVMQKKRFVLSRKYDREWKDPKLFRLKFGKQYLVSQDICNRIDRVWREDWWSLLQSISEKRSSGSLTKNEQRLVEILFNNLNELESSNCKLFPSSILMGLKDYQVRRRLGSGSQYKEIQWLGESFAVKHFFGEIEPLLPDISLFSSLAHPNVAHFLCGFCDEEKKECFLVMELMHKDLNNYIKENCGARKRVPFSLTVAVDIMLQIARGMEYLHSRKIYHGELNPSNILVRTKNSSLEGYLHVKIAGFNLSVIRNFTPRSVPAQNGTKNFIWYAPEVLLEQEQPGSLSFSKCSEKADVYSFGMICFELLTGKVPFEDSHLQGDKMSRNIRAGERPLFPFASLKSLVNLTKKCWQTEPTQRPSFSSICRVLRYIKKFLVMNPDHNQPEAPSPLIDYWELEAGHSKMFSTWENQNLTQVSQIPFHMFAYKVLEKEKINVNLRERSSESGSDGGASICEDENSGLVEDAFPPAIEKKPIVPEPNNKKTPTLKKITDGRNSKPGTPRGRMLRPPNLDSCARSLRLRSESTLIMSPSRRRASGHASDSELP